MPTHAHSQAAVYLQRFGPSDHQYYYMDSDDARSGDPQLIGMESEDKKGKDWLCAQTRWMECCGLMCGWDVSEAADGVVLRKRGAKN